MQTLTPPTFADYQEQTQAAHQFTIKIAIQIAIISIVSTLLVWAPFFIRSNSLTKSARTFGFESIARNYDGMLFVIPAKSNYRSDQIEKLKVLDLKHTYYAAHLPGYPLLIKMLAPLFGYLESMILINIISSVVLGWLLYLFYLHFFRPSQPLLLVAVTLLMPRLWILRSTGSSEIVFLCCIIASSLLLDKKRYILAALTAAYASFTRVHGVLYGVGLSLHVLYLLIRTKKLHMNMLSVAIASFFGFVFVCFIYLRQYGDFFAYFHTGAVVPMGFIYSQFDSTAKEIKTFFLEDLLVYFAFVWTYLYDQYHKKKTFLFSFVLVYFVFTLTIQHRDIARYILPIMPVLIGAASPIFEKKSVQFALLMVFPAIYWYVVNFIGSNMFLDSMKAFQ